MQFCLGLMLLSVSLVVAKGLLGDFLATDDWLEMLHPLSRVNIQSSFTV